jgi:hypothetical protein
MSTPYKLGARPKQPKAFRKTDVIGWLLARDTPFTVNDLARGLGIRYDTAAAYLSLAHLRWGMLEVTQERPRPGADTGRGRRVYRKVS